ncbi:ribbon-helix-helix protein, CopG family [Dactylosporangium matsuzakiense]|uniref:Ribbon-helix-helix protein CopG domain-containing protein n=1 Tax=Dactylosporangium matsuzakiense TaxID=53360 RepID=A0A9W6KV35_9ACTN|nr:ribbon-helix-helix protein, CopG family [Dactylosporangium matsuzakiense]GLL07234.1 hypothetical protein GCM10017581_089860 [Dactylosporangium matsuzakiense]
MAAPDFEAMSRDEVAQWLMDNDSGAVMATLPAGPTGRFVQVDEAGSPVPQLVTVKMPSDVVARLDVAAQRDHEGRSGIIQQAVVEWLERHSPAA